MRLALTIMTVAMLGISCSKVGKKDFSVYLIEDFQVQIDGLTGDFEVDICDVFSALDDAEVANVKEELVEYQIEELSFRIWEYVGPENAVYSGSMEFARPSDSQIQVTHLVGQSSIKELEEAGKHIIDLSEVQQETIKGTLLNEHGVKILFHGDVDDAPMSFVVQILVRLTATSDSEG